MLFKSLENIKDEPEIMINPKFSTIGFSHQSFLNKLEDGSFGDNKIKSEIINGNYFNYDFFDDPKIRPIFQKIWTNKTFLKNVIELLDSDKQYRDKIIASNITSINHIVYDYIVSENPDEEIMKLMYDVAKIVDYMYVINLCSIMPLDIAKLMPLARFSTFDIKTSIDRLNHTICTCGVDFSKKNIIYIYSIFFSSGFSTLFNATMTTNIETFANRSYKKMYDMISLAMLDILESMTSADIYKVLHDYGEYVSLSKITTIRFSMRSLSDDYSRINGIILQLLDNGISIP
ncbi:MAG: hypothetical protein J6Y02_19860 [Pseudobutyrivibrio sp.]|nr:hypothetical protein [Pseudobutyrivibrio sp.]